MKSTVKIAVRMMMCITVLMMMCGCGFSVGTSQDKLDYKEVFTDRYQEASQDGAWKGTMVEYKYSLPGYGDMSIYVDTTDGHTFELIEGSSAFQVKDADGNIAVTGVMMDQDQYKMITSYANNSYKINGREYCGLVNEYNSLDLYSYMADCGVDGGLCIEATEESLFRLVAFRGTPIEGALDQSAYKGAPVEVSDDVDNTVEVTTDEQVSDVTELFDEDTIGFADGYTFDLSDTRIEEHNGYYFKIEGSESVLETAVTNDYSAVDAGQTMADSLKANSGKAPVMDIHDEGVYITGIYDNQFMLCFLADGADTTYIMSMRTVDTDNSIAIFNSIISDFLAGGATDNSVRTEYGQEVDGNSEPIEESNTTSVTPKEGTYYNAPKGYECSYSCDFFEDYTNNEYEYQFNFECDEELLAFANGTGDTYIGYTLTKISEVDSSYGKVIIAERSKDGNFYRYHAVSADGTVCIDFNTYLSEKIDKSTCEKLIKDVVK